MNTLQEKEIDQSPLSDICTIEDIKTMIDGFYALAKDDDLIGKAFVGVDWQHHLPIMYQFWAFLLLNQANAYNGNPFEKHKAVHMRFPLSPTHFDRWVYLFQQNIDKNFIGPKAEEAKFKAYSIAATWKPKFSSKP